LAPKVEAVTSTQGIGHSQHYERFEVRLDSGLL
jgi:hypothetical protein